jgi:hypothetical protein
VASQKNQFYAGFDRLVRREAPSVQRVTLFEGDTVLWDTTGMVGPDEMNALAAARDGNPVAQLEGISARFAVTDEGQLVVLVPVGERAKRRALLLSFSERQRGSDVSSAARSSLQSIEAALHCLMAFEARPAPEREGKASAPPPPPVAPAHDFARELCMGLLEPSPPKRVFRLLTATLRALGAHAAIIDIPDYKEVHPLVSRGASARDVEEWLRAVSHPSAQEEMLRVITGAHLRALSPPSSVGGLVSLVLDALPGSASGYMVVALPDASRVPNCTQELTALPFLIRALLGEEREPESGALNPVAFMERARVAMRGKGNKGAGTVLGIALDWPSLPLDEPRAAVAARCARFLRRVLPDDAVLGRAPGGPFMVLFAHDRDYDWASVPGHLLSQARGRRARQDATPIPTLSIGCTPVTPDADLVGAVRGAVSAAFAACAAGGDRARRAGSKPVAIAG